MTQRKPGLDAPPLTLRIPDDLHLQISEEASRAGVTREEYIRNLIDEDRKDTESRRRKR